MDIKFTYRNHSGKESERHICVDSIEFVHTTGFGYQPGWFISGYDYDKKARRSFRLSHIVFEEGNIKPFQLIIREQAAPLAYAKRNLQANLGRHGQDDVQSQCSPGMYDIPLYTTQAYETCASCGGAGLALNMSGEPDICKECKGDTVTPIVPE